MSIKLVKAWFAVGLLIALFHIFQNGIGWSLLELSIPLTGLFVLAYRYPWGRIFVTIILSIHFAFLSWGAVQVVWIASKSIYISLTADENILRKLDQIGARPDPQYLMKALLILFAIGLLAFFVWLITDLFRNEKVKRYFVATEELSSERKSV